MKFFFKKIPLLILFITALCLFAWSAQAQNSVIPYQGTLFSQGKPVSQSTPIRMAFAIYSDSAGLEAGQDGSAPSGEARKWTSWDATGEGSDAVDNLDETVGVQVRNGRFLVHLGEIETGQQSLGDDVFDASELYVVAWVMQDPQNPNAVFRLPPQRLQTVPHAVTAKRANGFEVTGTLKVDTISPRTAGSSVEITSGLQTDDVEVSGSLSLKGTSVPRLLRTSPYNNTSGDYKICTGVSDTSWVSFGGDGLYNDIDVSSCGFSVDVEPQIFTSLYGDTSHFRAIGVSNIYSVNQTGFRVFITGLGNDPSVALPPRSWRVNWIAIGK